MYFIAYVQGRKVFDGYAPSVEKCVALLPGTLTFESQVGAEQKWSDAGNSLLPVMYIRPTR